MDAPLLFTGDVTVQPMVGTLGQVLVKTAAIQTNLRTNQSAFKTLWYPSAVLHRLRPFLATAAAATAAATLLPVP
jgi:hypothetical protein